MADLTQGQLTDTPSEIGGGSIFKTGDQIIANEETLKKREEAEVWGRGGVVDAFYDQALKDNTLAKIMDFAGEAAYTDFKDEEDYNMDDTTALGMLEANGLSIKHFGDVRAAKSDEELNFRLAQALRAENTDQQINDALSDTARVTASVTGGLLDIDIVAGLGVGMVTKSANLAKVMMYDGITESSLVATRYMVNKDYTIEDAVFDMSIGLAITAGANKLVHSFRKPATGVPKDNDAVDMTNRTWTVADVQPSAARATDVKARQATTDMMNAGKPAKAADDIVEEVDVVARRREVRHSTYRAMGMNKDEVAKLEARRLQQEKAGLTPQQIRQMDAGKEVKGVAQSKIDLINLVEDMSSGVRKVKDDVYNLIKQAPKEDVAELKEIVNELIEQSPKEMQAVKRLLNSKLNNTTFEKTMRSIEDLDLSPAAKKKLLAMSVIVGATGAQAAEDGNIVDELTGTFLLMAGAFVLGPSILKKIRNANVRERLKTVGNAIEQAYHKAEVASSPQAKMIHKVGRLIADSAHTRITSTIAPYLKAGGNAKKIMGDLVYSAENGGGAETTKAMWAHGTMFKYASAENQAFKAWKAERGITTTSNILDDMGAIHKFRHELTDNMEMRNSNSRAIQEMTTKADEIMGEVWSRPKEYGVFGFEKISYKAGMIPRLWNSAKLNNIVNNVSDADQLRIRDSISNAIFKTNGDKAAADKIADRYLASWKKGFSADMSVSRAEDVFGSASKLFKDDVDFEDFADAMNIPKDRNARAKFRVDFDVNAIEDVTVNINGIDTILTKADFVERDYKSILDRVANSMYGSAAIAQKGYKSTAQLTKAIDGVSNPTMRKELQQVADLVLGNPIASNNKFLHEISMIAKDLTMVAKLPFVVFSMPPELISTLGNAGFTKGLRALANGVASTFGKDSAMLNDLSRVSGLGTGTTRLDFSGYRGLTDDITDLDDAGITSKIREGTMRLRDFSMLANGLSYFSDVLQRANLQLNAEKFANFVISGKQGAAGINKSRLRSFGIDDDTISMFENTFEMNSKGRLKDYDMSKWSIKKQDKFGEILRNMNQTVSPETTIGETGLYTRTTDLGRMASSLISYPMQQFNIHGLHDMKHFDRMTFLHSVGGFGGAYIGLQSRYAIQGKEVDDDQILLYALMNVPQFGGVSAITSMASPATLDTVQSALNVVGMDKK